MFIVERGLHLTSHLSTKFDATPRDVRWRKDWFETRVHRSSSVGFLWYGDSLRKPLFELLRDYPSLVGLRKHTQRGTGAAASCFDDKNRTLRGQKGMVDAGESSLLHNTRKSPSLWPPSFVQSVVAWPLTSLSKSFSVEATTRSFHLYKTAIRHHSPPASIRMRVDGFAGRLIVRTTVRQLSIIFNHGRCRNA